MMTEKSDKQGGKAGRQYQPMDCATHDRLELAIIREQMLSLQWTDDSGVMCQAQVKPLDVVTCKGVEYLNFLNAGHETIIRLDHIVAFEIGE